MYMVQIQWNHLWIQSRPGSSQHFNLFFRPSVFSSHLGDLDTTIRLLKREQTIQGDIATI
ncbi:hypothetical protein DAPPUDRAFT_246367 [Daphnia pulex]|uniref:Uncharacterized protein n=1 Tax=Daphnia pulex TaxID=6669 RepID=E9GQB0_DAPPU|nr:hypothetical protein DAPPUDRAFT_246367 [Daphnia pulex]|eukprot:EFX78373.1 hypothetical protein DAPPUDRAFT_246367 [Daphnia pulex]